jgi:hypothetical protein
MSINLTLTLEAKMGWITNGTNVFDAFDFKVFIFQKYKSN